MTDVNERTAEKNGDGRNVFPQSRRRTQKDSHKRNKDNRVEMEITYISTITKLSKETDRIFEKNV
jgi:hypothetical protein